MNKLLEDLDDTIRTSKRKEESLIFNKTFLSHCNKVFAKMTINLFTAERFQMLNGTMWFPPEVIRDCTRLFSVGENNTKTLFSQDLFLDPRRLFRQA